MTRRGVVEHELARHATHSFAGAREFGNVVVGALQNFFAIVRCSRIRDDLPALEACQR